MNPYYPWSRGHVNGWTDFTIIYFDYTFLLCLLFIRRSFLKEKNKIVRNKHYHAGDAAGRS